MPTYQYRCQQCDALTEAVQKFTDDPLTECPQCDDGQLRKVYNAVGIVFKGSGFYATDSRSGGAKKAATTSSSETKSSSSTPKESAPKKDAPAAKPASSTGGSKTD